MSKIKLFIAATIDGFIARKDGSLDWLFELPNPNNIDHGYEKFFNTIGVVVMGRKTYDEVLGFDVEWPYGNCKTFVITSDKNFSTNTENTFVLNQINKKSIEQLKSESQKDIWLVGGGKTITAFLNLDAVDEMILSIIPIVLGEGIRLFPDGPKETRFHLTNTEKFETGIVNLWFTKQEQNI